MSDSSNLTFIPPLSFSPKHVSTFHTSAACDPIEGISCGSINHYYE